MNFNQLNEVAETYKIGKGGKDGWLVLEPGDNKVRIVSEYEILAKHWSANKAVICIGEKNHCILCETKEGEKPNKPVVKFLLWVIDRRDGKLKIAELGWTVVKAIGDLQQDSDYKFSVLPEYDINIKKTVKGNGSKPSDTEYTIIPARGNTPLTPEEVAAIKDLTPISEVIQSLKDKVLKDYEAMGLGSEAEPASEDAPPLPEEE